MRILQIGKYYPPYKGGMETHLELLCRRLAETDEVEALVANTERTTSHSTVDGVKVTRNATWFHLAGAPVCPGMSRRIITSNPDLIHFHHPNPSGMISYLRSRSRAPLIVTYHGDIVRQRFTGGLFMPILRRVLNKASLILVSSPNYLNSSPVLARNRSRCRVVPFGILTHPFESADEEETRLIRQKYGPRIVLSVGRFIYYKGYEYLIRAMKRVNAKLVLVGSGPLRGKLEREALRCGVSSSVEFLSEVHDIAPYYKSADVFVLPSIARSEAFGITQLEAMAAGVPVVNTMIDSGVPWVCPDGETGITVPPKNPDALSAAINALLENKSLCSRLGEAGRKRVKENFTADLMVSRIREAYEEVVGDSPPLRHRPAVPPAGR